MEGRAIGRTSVPIIKMRNLDLANEPFGNNPNRNMPNAADEPNRTVELERPDWASGVYRVEFTATA